MPTDQPLKPRGDLQKRREQDAAAEFWKAAFLAAIPSAMSGAWKLNGEELLTVMQKMSVAQTAADTSLNIARERGFVK